MPVTCSINNSRIAKNTILLYGRMLFSMAVSLFTSRIILSTLGVEDFGVQNAVGGVVGMFGFINASMSSATQRYITFALGKGDFEHLVSVFRTSAKIHLLIAVVVLVLAESVGIWFLLNKMQIPDGRMTAAMWVFQCSILSTMVMIVSVPYNATIIAHENMSAFAFISVGEVVLKLLIVFVLMAASTDKLILYAILLLAVQIVVRIAYTVYCHSKYPETKARESAKIKGREPADVKALESAEGSSKSLFSEMLSFAGWSVFGNLSAVLFSEGVNLLLNIFFGPVVNAARGVAVQIQNVVSGFVSNFQMALNPQITKTYANNEMEAMHKLMYRSARFSFILMLCIALPALFEMDILLKIWLKTVPENAAVFARIMLCTSLIYTIANPMIVANQATGKVKRYQIVCGSILLMILPISYVCLKLGLPPYVVFVVHFCVEGLTHVARMVMLRPLINVKIADFVKNVYLRVLGVTAVSVVAPALVYFNMEEGFVRLLLVAVSGALSVAAAGYTIGITPNERIFIGEKLRNLAGRLKISPKKND